MIDDLECYLCHIDESDYRRFGLAAFHWIFQKTQNDKQVLSVWSVCYMIGCDVNELRTKLIDRQESNDKLRARVVRLSDNEFRITEIKHTEDALSTSESHIRSIGAEC